VSGFCSLDRHQQIGLFPKVVVGGQVRVPSHHLLGVPSGEFMKRDDEIAVAPASALYRSPTAFLVVTRSTPNIAINIQTTLMAADG
jgi:hypothetical protein